MLTVNAYGATSAADPLVPMTAQRRDLGPHDVLIEIRYCGICHTDITHARSEWRPEPYPLIPGTSSPASPPRSALASPGIPRAIGHSRWTYKNGRHRQAKPR
jgi:threonine dehydrogenase-like Zn-dependent dehydrogenase